MNGFFLPSSFVTKPKSSTSYHSSDSTVPALPKNLVENNLIGKFTNNTNASRRIKKKIRKPKKLPAVDQLKKASALIFDDLRDESSLNLSSLQRNDDLLLDEKFNSAVKELEVLKKQLHNNNNNPLEVQVPSTNDIQATNEDKSANDTEQKRLKVAEAAMRRLYKQNVALERQVNTLTQQLEAKPKVVQVVKELSPEEHAALRSQEHEYLWVLAAEQDRVISDLREKVLGATSNQAEKLEKALCDSREDTSRIKENYSKLRGDYKKLLTIRSRSFQSQDTLHASAHEFITLMEERLERQELEAEVELASYSSKLFECEQELCDAVVASRMGDKTIEKNVADIIKRLRHEE